MKRGKHMISNLVFDMGGVLIRWNPEYMLGQCGLSPEEIAILNRELFRSVEWIQQDRGTLSAQEVVERRHSPLSSRLLFMGILRVLRGWMDGGGRDRNALPFGLG